MLDILQKFKKEDYKFEAIYYIDNKQDVSCLSVDYTRIWKDLQLKKVKNVLFADALDKEFNIHENQLQQKKGAYKINVKSAFKDYFNKKIPKFDAHDNITVQMVFFQFNQQPSGNQFQSQILNGNQAKNNDCQLLMDTAISFLAHKDYNTFKFHINGVKFCCKLKLESVVLSEIRRSIRDTHFNQISQLTQQQRENIKQLKNSTDVEYAKKAENFRNSLIEYIKVSKLEKVEKLHFLVGDLFARNHNIF